MVTNIVLGVYALILILGGYFGFKKGSMPEAEKYYEECLSLPMYPSITKEEHEYVIACIREFFS